MKKVQGIALITVMLIVALAAIIATHLLANVRLELKKSSNIEFNQQAYWYAMGAESFAIRALSSTFEQESEKTTLKQAWAQGETTYPVDLGEITGEITDLQSCFNLNSLRVVENENAPLEKKSSARQAFEALVLALEIDYVDQFEAEYLADALVDWLDDNSTLVSSGGAEDSDYAAKTHAYLAANQYLASVNELRVIEHFTPVIINELKPFVCVLPTTNLHKININTISPEQPELLQALLSISKGEAEQILSSRKAEGFDKIEDFYNMAEVSRLNLKDEQKQQFTVDSEFFKLKTTAMFNDSYFYLNSIMQVVNNNQINVIGRTIGRE